MPRRPRPIVADFFPSNLHRCTTLRETRRHSAHFASHLLSRGAVVATAHPRINVRNSPTSWQPSPSGQVGIGIRTSIGFVDPRATSLASRRCGPTNAVAVLCNKRGATLTESIMIVANKYCRHRRQTSLTSGKCSFRTRREWPIFEKGFRAFAVAIFVPPFEPYRSRRPHPSPCYVWKLPPSGGRQV